MITNILLGLTLLITLGLSATMHYMLKYNRNFLKQIQSIRGTLLDMIELGEEAPLFRSIDESGKKVIAKKLFYEKNTLLFFGHSECPACKGILKHIQKIEQSYDINIIVVNRDTQFDDTSFKKLLNDEIYYIRQSFIADTYRIQTTPSVFLIENGVVKANTVLKDSNTLFNLLLNEKRKTSLNQSLSS
ncbi:peroxiredoxin family protein [Exiguobacterium acetylicum]|uniref:peroxiredoxin family protein n=1 Tax=Exiguobacterium acetylicum TaxID=41170 RepID=UPI0006801D2C|nr:thioredoxin family protein [Exiguobacterium acetylicum]KNH35612.1 hypothetical protein ACS74_06935 [Exiguobacterium acetylicum]